MDEEEATMVGTLILAMLLGGAAQQDAPAPAPAGPPNAAQQTAPAPRVTTPAPPPAAVPAAPQGGMSPEEANAAIDKLRNTVRESAQNRRGPNRDMDPET